MVGSCEGDQSGAANRALRLNQPCLTVKKGILLFLLSSATLSYAISAIPNLTWEKHSTNIISNAK